MKTLTVKSANDIPVNTTYIINVDGKNIGEVKAGETAYFEIDDQAKKIIAKIPGASSEMLDISSTEHQQIIIETKRNFIYQLLSVILYIIISFCATFFLKLEFVYSMMVNVGLAIIIYIIFKKSRFNGLQISLRKNI